jgi:hypothetical protein
MNLYQAMAKRIPREIQEIIIEGRLIESAINTEVTGTPMEYLFDVYEEFLDAIGEHDNWTCYKCREHILHDWRQMKPFLKLAT